MNNKASQELLVYFNEVFRWRSDGGWECNFPESSSLKCPLWTVIPFYGGWTIQMESEESLDFRGTRSCFWKAVTCTLLRIRVTPVLRTCLSGPQAMNRLHARQRVCLCHRHCATPLGALAPCFIGGSVQITLSLPMTLVHTQGSYIQHELMKIRVSLGG